METTISINFWLNQLMFCPNQENESKDIYLSTETNYFFWMLTDNAREKYAPSPSFN